MKILITYATKYGSTAEIAEKIDTVLREAGLQTELLPVKQGKDLAPSTAVILGSAVYIGRWRKEAVQFLEGIFTAIKWHQLLLINVDSDIFTKAWKLRKKFQDKPNISFTDLTSMAIMREFKIEMILTDDDHFLHVGMGFSKTI